MIFRERVPNSRFCYGSHVISDRYEYTGNGLQHSSRQTRFVTGFHYKTQTAQNNCITNMFRSGQGTMALCTALSSSTFDVLICLGVPWFIKAMWFHKANSSASLTVHSRSLDDSAIAVMISTIGFMLLMYGKKFILTKRVRTEVFIIFVFIIIFS